MLDSFRDNARSWVIQVIIGAIAVVFIFSFGPGSRGCESVETTPTWSAKVNGTSVPASNFANAYAQRVAYLQQLGFSKPEDLRMIKVRENVMKEVVDNELYAQAAEKNGIYVSDDELAKTIERIYTQDGHFDTEGYRDALRRDRKLEDRIRRSLMAERMRMLITGAVTVSEQEVLAEFLKQNEAAAIDYVRFSPSQFADKVQVSDADVEKTLNEKKADIEKKFKENSALYVEPHAIKARRIFVPVKQNATKEEEDAAKKKIDDAQAQLKAGKGWDEVAGGFKDSTETADLGWVALGQSTLDRATEEAIFKLKPGQRSDVVRAKFGYEIIEAQEDRPAVEKKLEAVQKEIARDIAKDDKMKELAKAAANDALTKLKAGQSLTALFPEEKPVEGSAPNPFAAANPQAKSTDEFHPAGGVIPQVGSAPKVSAASFALSADKRVPDAVIEDQNAFWVIQLKSRTRADLSQLTAEKKSELRSTAERTKQTEMLEAWTETAKKDAKVEENQTLLSYDQRRATGDEG
jgi:peptidyl-prolyl cis-trans isomerase D